MTDLNNIINKLSVLSPAVHPALTLDETEKLNISVVKFISYEIPPEVVEFLKLRNGFDFNGFRIFGHFSKKSMNTDDLLINNEIRRESGLVMKLLFLGDSNMDEYYYNYEAKKYEIRDRYSFEIFSKFETFVQLIEVIVDQAS
jgi:hypothetical protein